MNFISIWDLKATDQQSAIIPLKGRTITDPKIKSDISDFLSKTLPFGNWHTGLGVGVSHEPYLVCNFSLIAVYALVPKSHFIHKFTWVNDDCDRGKKIHVTFPWDFPFLVSRVERNARRNSDEQDIGLMFFYNIYCLSEHLSPESPPFLSLKTLRISTHNTV